MNNYNQIPALPETPKKKMGCGKMLLIGIACVFGLFLIAGIIGSLLPNSPKTTDKTALVDSTKVDMTADTTLETTEKSLGKTWQYDERFDEMSDKTDYFASLVSDNSHEFDFPYQGGSWGKLTIRKSQKYGLDVYFNVSKGQLLCSDYNGTNYITVRFDDKPAKKYYTTDAADGSSDVLFLRNPKDFIINAKSSKVIKVQVPVYEEGNPIFEFTVDTPLEWNH